MVGLPKHQFPSGYYRRPSLSTVIFYVYLNALVSYKISQSLHKTSPTIFLRPSKYMIVTQSLPYLFVNEHTSFG